MTPSDLKYNVEKTGSYFFNRSSMKFFGDTMANYGTVESYDGPKDCRVLTRKRAVKHGISNNAYFCKETFERLIEKKG